MPTTLSAASAAPYSLPDPTRYYSGTTRGGRLTVNVVRPGAPRPHTVRRLRRYVVGTAPFATGPGEGGQNLALSVLTDYLQDAYLALQLYRAFAEQVVAPLPPRAPFTLPAETLRGWLDSHLTVESLAAAEAAAMRPLAEYGVTRER